MSQNLIQEIIRLNDEIDTLKEQLHDYNDATAEVFYLIGDYEDAQEEIRTLQRDLANANRGCRVSMAATKAHNFDSWADNTAQALTKAIVAGWIAAPAHGRPPRPMAVDLAHTHWKAWTRRTSCSIAKKMETFGHLKQKLDDVLQDPLSQAEIDVIRQDENV